MSSAEAAPKGDQEPAAETGPVVLEASKVLNMEGLARVLPLVVGPSNKYGVTRIFPGSAVVERSTGTVQPVFLHSVVAGLVPPFSDFFLAILSHYDIHLLHLQPNSSRSFPYSPSSTKLSWA